MASITLTINDAFATRVLDGFCGHHGYQATIPGPPDISGNPTTIPNPETKMQFMKRLLYAMIKRDVASYESDVARAAAAAAAGTDIVFTP